MIWLCELLSDFICNALGSLAAGIKAVAQGGNFFDGVRDFICGPEATDEEAGTIQGMFQVLVIQKMPRPYKTRKSYEFC